MKMFTSNLSVFYISFSVLPRSRRTNAQVQWVLIFWNHSSSGWLLKIYCSCCKPLFWLTQKTPVWLMHTISTVEGTRLKTTPLVVTWLPTSQLESLYSALTPADWNVGVSLSTSNKAQTSITANWTKKTDILTSMLWNLQRAGNTTIWLLTTTT